MSKLEKYFSFYRKHIIGQGVFSKNNMHNHPILYADWTASGRLYEPIESYMTNYLGPYVANTHTETTLTGTVMTKAYAESKQVIRKHVNATKDDVLLFSGYGMTSVVNKFQRLLGLQSAQNIHDKKKVPLVIVTHMEHYSNQVSWAECNADLAILRRDESTGLPDLNHLRKLLKANQHREQIIGAFTACSNATGIITPYHKMAALLHEYNGICVMDFAASAPYVSINMHPENPMEKLDAIFFSPHKFLGGPGTSGVMLFDSKLYQRTVPDQPGGGTVTTINKQGKHQYTNIIEEREDGGTPGFLQAIRTSLAVKLKEHMGVENILNRERELVGLLFEQLRLLPELTLLEPHAKERISIVSFYVKGLHHNFIVKVLNDHFGIQTRGGVSCAGHYGKILLGTKQGESIGCQKSEAFDSSPSGWVRVSLHPTMENKEVLFIAAAITRVVKNTAEFKKHYNFESNSGEYIHKSYVQKMPDINEFDPCPIILNMEKVCA